MNDPIHEKIIQKANEVLSSPSSPIPYDVAMVITDLIALARELDSLAESYYWDSYGEDL